MATASDSVVLGSPAGDFQLRGTDERIYSFDDVAGERGTVNVFICNHCPYVKAVIDRVVQDALALQDERIGSRRSARTMPPPIRKTRSRT